MFLTTNIYKKQLCECWFTGSLSVYIFALSVSFHYAKKI